MAIAPKTCYNTPKYSREVGALGALDAPNSVLARVFLSFYGVFLALSTAPIRCMHGMKTVAVRSAICLEMSV